MMIYTRDEWGADSPKGGYPMNYQVNEFYIHHFNGGIAAPTTVAESKSRMRGALAFHRDTQGWGDIGYSFCFDNAGNIYEGRGWYRTGAHTYGYNSKGYAACWLGDSNVSRPTLSALEAAALICLDGIRFGAISPNPTIVAHRDRVPDTSCCGDPMYAQIPDIRALVGGNTPITDISTPTPATALTNGMEYDMNLYLLEDGRYLLVDGARKRKILNPTGNESWEQVNGVMVGLANAGAVARHPDGTPVIGSLSNVALDALLNPEGWA